MFNTVRRMTDTDLTILPLSKVTFRVGYSQNIFQGPPCIPGSLRTAKTNMLFEEMNGTAPTSTGAVDWKPRPQTNITYEEAGRPLQE